MARRFPRCTRLALATALAAWSLPLLAEPRARAPRVAPAPEVTEKSSAEGVKTYRFGAIEVEGRLRSPQVIYFLRRVRAEFDAAALGHRSFLRELRHTRHDTTFR